MPRLLHIQSSPNIEHSVTRKLTEKFVRTWTSHHANVEVDLLDLAAQPLPHFGLASLQSMMLPSEQWSDPVREAAALSDRLIKQLEEAQIVVIGAPMFNFTICTQLKAWIDHITVAGRTFKYSAPGVAKGLVFGKKVFVVEARGGDYADAPISAYDHQEPLLRANLGFLGMFDVTFIRAEGMRQRVEETADILRHAEAVIDRVAA